MRSLVAFALASLVTLAGCLGEPAHPRPLEDGSVHLGDSLNVDFGHAARGFKGENDFLVLRVAAPGSDAFASDIRIAPGVTSAVLTPTRTGLHEVRLYLVRPSLKSIHPDSRLQGRGIFSVLPPRDAGSAAAAPPVRAPIRLTIDDG